MNLLAIIGTYYFFAVRLEINFDYNITPTDEKLYSVKGPSLGYLQNNVDGH